MTTSNASPPSRRSDAQINPPGPPLPVLRENGARLLSFDGGGVKGVSAVMLLDAIMRRVRDIELASGESADQTNRKPVDYFDLAAGTSTGGLIALMLFRLKMDTQECLKVYRSLAKDIFTPTLFGSKFLGSLFRTPTLILNAIFYDHEFLARPLKKAVEKVVDEYSNPSDKWRNSLVHPNSGMMFMCATLADAGESLLLRSYPQPDDAVPVTPKLRQVSESGAVNRIDITSAARATSAAPIYLPPEKWHGITFWDGGVLNNNPISQLWDSRFDLVQQGQPPPVVNFVMSFGCGHSEVKTHSIFKIFNTIARYIESFMANTEAKNLDFRRLVQRMRGRHDQDGHVKYFRLNADCGTKIFDMSDPSIMPALEKLTQEYIDGDAKQDIEQCARLLASRR
ncbi:hypothetical protein M433DRAFT_172960 [Acidomyces richmondensis BFW]|nr:hypothetical protein M433DRAFT_172960 [Acidomyces richmondensis BFW]